MARVTGKYDVRFDRGESGFSSVFGTFIGTRLKENKERLAREFKAADPTNEYKILKDLMDERRKLYGDLTRLKSSSTAGGTVTVRDTPGDRVKEADYLRDVEDENRRRGVELDQGIGIAAGLKDEVRSFIKGPGELSTDNRVKLAKRLYNDKQKAGIRNADVNAGLARGMAKIAFEEVYDIDKETGKPRLDKETGKPRLKEGVTQEQKEAADAIATAMLSQQSLTQDQVDAAINPGMLTREQQARRLMYRKGERQITTQTKRQGAGLSPDVLAGFYTKRLGELDALIRDQEQRYRSASDEYKQLARGTNRNLALAPLSSRPSALSESMDAYADFIERDRGLAERSLQDSIEDGTFSISDRFAQAKSQEGFAGQSPLDILLDTTGTLSLLRTDLGDGVKRNLDKDDVDLVRGSLERAQRAIKSLGFENRDFGSLTFPSGQKSLVQFVDEAVDLFDRVPEDKQAMYAQGVTDKLIEWQNSKSDDDLRSLRRDTQPAQAVSTSIQKVQNAYTDFKKTGDQSKLQNTLSTERQFLDTADSEVGGGIVDTYRSQYDDFSSTPQSERDIDYFVTNVLNDLKLTADETSVANIGVSDE